MIRRAALALALALVSRMTASAAPLVASEHVVLHTNAGDIVLALYPDDAPRHVKQILKLVRLGAYDTAHFLRVIPGFIVQIADVTDRLAPLTEDQAAAIRPLKAEFSSLHHEPGVLSMSRDESDPNSAQTSFSIILGDWPEGDKRYTIFGHVQEGMDVIDEFLKIPRDGDDQPATRLEILSAEVVTAAQLTQRTLDPAHPVTATPAETQTAERGFAAERAKLLVAALIFMVLLVLAAYTASIRYPKAASTLNLINVLVGVFILFAVLTPNAHLNRALSIAIFIGLLCTFKLMSRFENAS